LHRTNVKSVSIQPSFCEKEREMCTDIVIRPTEHKRGLRCVRTLTTPSNCSLYAVHCSCYCCCWYCFFF